MSLPDWKLPPGVPRGVWDYTQLRSIADDYDTYHAGNPLFEIEQNFIEEVLGEPSASAAGVNPGTIADLGCGSGRALIPLVRRGWRGLDIDLSEPMLEVVRQKAAAENLPIECVRANLVELTPDVVPDATADHALCLFSTIGMIRGRQSRIAALRHMHRILKPGGKLVLHAHNFWWNLRDPGGPWWAIKSLARGARFPLPLRGRAGVGAPHELSHDARYEIGDRTYPYRGVPNFFLHVFRSGELRADLRAAGFRLTRWTPLDAPHGRVLPRPWLAPSLRASGWLVAAQKK